MESSLPATRTDSDVAPAEVAPADAERRTVTPPSRPVSVALIPLAIVWFVIIAFVMAAWTFLATAF